MNWRWTDSSNADRCLLLERAVLCSPAAIFSQFLKIKIFTENVDWNDDKVNPFKIEKKIYIEKLVETIFHEEWKDKR